MARNYWSGNKRIISDILWSSIIAFFLELLGNGKMPFTVLPSESLLVKIIEFAGVVIGVFFLFFFWSWNHYHIKCRAAKYVVCAFFFYLELCAFLGLILAMFTDFFSDMNWTILLCIMGFFALATWKYIKLMWRKKKLENNPELEHQK